MIYRVRARLRPGAEAALLKRITDGSVAGQKPDGAEIVASMQRAAVTADGEVRWSETCYCSPPLKHERETVLDAHFEAIQTEPVEAHEHHEHHEGTPLMAYLRQLAGD